LFNIEKNKKESMITVTNFSRQASISEPFVLNKKSLKNLQNDEFNESDILCLSKLSQSDNVISSSPLFYNFIIDSLVKIEKIYKKIAPCIKNRSEKTSLKDAYSKIHSLMLAPYLHSISLSDGSLLNDANHGIKGKGQNPSLKPILLQYEVSMCAIQILINLCSSRAKKKHVIAIDHDMSDLKKNIKDVQKNMCLIKKLMSIKDNDLLSKTPLHELCEFQIVNERVFDSKTHKKIIDKFSRSIYKTHKNTIDPSTRRIQKNVNVLYALHQQNSISIEQYISATVNLNDSISDKCIKNNDLYFDFLNSSVFSVYANLGEFFKWNLINKIEIPSTL
jgi:hypothetical protein